MPKLGMEPIRRKELIVATIAEIAASGSLDVTVGKIAKRAGMSSGLAHHYFGGKDQILMAAMRHILKTFSGHVQEILTDDKTALQRVEAIISASLHPRNFEPDVIAAWLSFYVHAQHSPEAQRLLKVYVMRLNSNLLFGLKQLTDDEHARTIACGLAAMIDGFYIRKALRSRNTDRARTLAIVTDYLHLQIERGIKD